MTMVGTLTAFVVMGALIYKAGTFVVQTILGGKAPTWVLQVLVLVFGLGASFLFQLNILPMIAPYFGGNLANLPLWAAFILTGIALAAIALGAVTGFQQVVALRGTSAAPSQASQNRDRLFW